MMLFREDCACKLSLLLLTWMWVWKSISVGETEAKRALCLCVLISVGKPLFPLPIQTRRFQTRCPSPTVFSVGVSGATFPYLNYQARIKKIPSSIWGIVLEASTHCRAPMICGEGKDRPIITSANRKSWAIRQKYVLFFFYMRDLLLQPGCPW